MVNTCMQVGQNTKVIGKKTNSTVRVKRLGVMVLNSKESIKRGRNMEKDVIHGLVAITMDSGFITK